MPVIPRFGHFFMYRASENCLLNTMYCLVAVTGLLVSCLGVLGADTFFSIVGENQHGFTFDQKVEILRFHNNLRREKGASNMNMLLWHNGLESLAQNWTDKCDYNHNRGRHHIVGFAYDYVGENLFLSNKYRYTTEAMDGWAAEERNVKEDFSCKSRSMCGHYAQMLWHDTDTVACGALYCDPVTGSSLMTRGFLIVCNYGPQGNKPNQPIWRKGDPCSQCPDDRTICMDKLCAPAKCQNLKCQHGEPVEDVCLCNCTGTGYDGEFCETKISDGSDTGSDGGSDTGSGNDSGTGSGSQDDVKRNQTAENSTGIADDEENEESRETPLDRL